MDKQIARKGSRIVLGQEKKYFYNPMWSRLGDDSSGNTGTYFYSSSKPINYFWNTFDQILIRPELLSCFEQENLQVIDSINNVSLISNGKPAKNVSDHLPIKLKLTMSAIS